MGLLRKIFGNELHSAVKIRCEETDKPVDAVIQSYANGKIDVVCPHLFSYTEEKVLGDGYKVKLIKSGCMGPREELETSRSMATPKCPYLKSKQ